MIRHMPVPSKAFTIALTAILRSWPLSLTQDQWDRLCAHFEAVVEANRVMNLTRITEPGQAAVKHYADSLSLLLWVDLADLRIRSVLDVGTGAGFPAVPLAVARPDWAVTAIDATRKKVVFVRRVAEAAGLANLHCEHAHSAHWRPGRRFDLVVSRAVADLPRVLAQSARHVAIRGRFVAYKTRALVGQELESARKEGATFGLVPETLFPYELELNREVLHRVLHVFRRTRESGRAKARD
jgi:16S rRNA (guanine527-N7)-methyltransferase